MSFTQCMKTKFYQLLLRTLQKTFFNVISNSTKWDEKSFSLHTWKISPLPLKRNRRNDRWMSVSTGLQAVILFVGLFLLSCEMTPSKPDELPDISLEYSVSIPSMPIDTVHVSCTIREAADRASITMLVPPIYADNPLLEQESNNFHNVLITDSDQNILSHTTDTLIYGIFKNCYITFPVTSIPITIEYDVTFNYESHPTMPVPHIGSSDGYLQGLYVFAVPFTASDMVDIWRSQYDMLVSYSLGSGVNLYGDPVTNASFDNPYELLFSTSALLSSSIVQNQILFEGTAQGQPFRFVNVSTSTTFTQSLLDSVKTNFIAILDDILPSFGTIGTDPFTIITGINDKIGLEGMYAFCLRNPKSGSSNALNMTMAHEMSHSWVGVRVGEYDDPWWKEGTATYLGLLIPKRNGLCSKEYIQETLLDTLGYVPAVDKYALSDRAIRPIIFTSPDNVATLVYRKGAQVSMLLDRYIRVVSGNTTTFDKILGAFVQQFDGACFHRNEYISFLNNHCNGDVQSIFTQYVDGTGAVPYSVLVENYNALDSLGAFGD